MPFRLLTLAAACAACLPALAHAEGATATDLDNVVVTANRIAVSIDETLAPVEVIDRAAIERSQARSLPDLLRGRAGLSITNQGGAGKLTTVFMRGTESDHVLVLVDGVRIGSATSGLAAFQDLPVELIDRVEIVRGPRSSLYGADAIGGVIQIFTRRDRRGFTPHGAVTLGSHDTREATLGFGGRGQRGWFGVDYSDRRTDGIDSCRVATPSYFGCGIAAPQPDSDGYDAQSASLRGGFDITDALTLDAHALRNEGTNDFDGDYVNRSATVQQVVGGALRWHANEHVDLSLVGGRDQDASESFLDGSFVGFFDTDRDSATLQADVQLAAQQQLSAGYDWLRDSVDSDTGYANSVTGAPVTRRNNRAAFVQYRGSFDALSLEASVRHDDNEQFGGHSTGSVALGYAFGAHWRGTASWGSAFKAPTFVELYYPFGIGNPDLQPERSHTVDLGVARHGDDWRLGANAFNTQVSGLVGFDSSFHAVNVDRAHIRGVELTGGTTLAGFVIDGSLSYVDPRNASGANDGLRLPRRARVGARLDVDRTFGDWTLGATAAGEGARYDDYANTRRVGGHALLDLRAEYAFASSWTLQARVANVFDQQYETVQYYAQPGREWFLTLRYATR